MMLNRLCDSYVDWARQDQHQLAGIQNLWFYICKFDEDPIKNESDRFSSPLELSVAIATRLWKRSAQKLVVIPHPINATNEI